ncbi:MAG: glycosyltransferase family 4 protein [Chloroflexota bacterium]|nr:glycosyltransferase family 4 protein [Chloroflexota bacterium]
MKPRILFLEVLPTIAGGQKVLIDLLSGDFPFEAHVLLPGRGPLAERLAITGTTCHCTPMSQYTLVDKTLADGVRYANELPRLSLYTARLARRVNADVIYANSGRAFLWGTLGALLSALPIVWHVHNMIADNKTVAIMRLFGRMPVVQRLICVCQAARQQFPGIYDKSTVIYNGVDTGSLIPAPELGQEVRNELAIPSQSLVIGIVGDLTPHKGQEIVLRAAGQLASQSTECVILIVGQERPNEESRSYTARLRTLANQLPSSCRVIFTGQRTDMPGIYNGMDILVVASLASETTSLTLQEAMACGKAVVASRTGGIPEIVKHGINGVLYPRGDVDGLAAQLIKLADDSALRAQIGVRARQTAQRQFGLERMCDQIVHELASILNESPFSHH